MDAGRGSDLIKSTVLADRRRRAAPRKRALGLAAPVTTLALAGVLVLRVAGPAGIGQGANGAAVVLYPDLRTVPPSDLSFDRLEDCTYILRFSNTIWNAGEGRLELEGNPNPKGNPNIVRKVYQNLYYDAVSGKRVRHREVASDTVYHPGHQHYHFANLAPYSLLKKEKRGAYKPTTKQGTKTSYCVIDTDLFEGAYDSMYGSCGQELQGMTPGWGDTYGAHLIDQWVVLGASPLADGEYGVWSIAGPKNLLKEGSTAREKNNTATIYFTVKNGEIDNVRTSP
jgi:hypothetical protein